MTTLIRKDNLQAEKKNSTNAKDAKIEKQPTQSQLKVEKEPGIEDKAEIDNLKKIKIDYVDPKTIDIKQMMLENLPPETKDLKEAVDSLINNKENSN